MRRHNTRGLLLSLPIALLVTISLLWAGTAFADGVMLRPAALPSADRASLLTAVTKAKAADPAAFQMVAKLHVDVIELDAKKRGRLAAVTPALKAMRGRALFPILEQLALDGLPRGDRNGSAWLAWRLGLLEALGSIRDARSASVLSAILTGNETSYPLVRAAAQALGKLGSTQAASKLITMSRIQDKKTRGIIAGMGHCRRAMVASRLAEIMSGARSDADVELYARALGDVANSWAWQTPLIAQTGEHSPTRDMALDALLNAFVSQASTHARKMIAQAVLVVDHPATKQRINAKKSGRSRSTQAALDALAKRFDNSPLR